jgi:hypothetical protein
MLPRVKINYLNGQLGTVAETTDGLMALVIGAVAVASTFVLNKAYTVTGMDDLAALGVTSVNNAELYKHVAEFYDEAETGTKLVLYGVSPTETMTDLCDYTKTDAGYIRDLITKLNGTLKGIAVANVNTETTAESADGIDPDVLTALPKAQQLAEWATTELYAPLFVALEGRNFDSTKTLHDFSTDTNNRCAVLLGDTESASKGACVGTLLGRIASIPVQRNIGRVKDGALAPAQMYIGSQKIDDYPSLVASIYDKGYIIPTKYVGKTGYYFCDDRMACELTDDYAHLTARRVIDKAYRICYTTLINELLDELEVNENGTLQTAVVKSWQQTVVNAIDSNMTAEGELSAGSDGDGCVCFIDETQNVVSTSKVEVTLKVRPFGYARYIDVNLGFDVTTV